MAWKEALSIAHLIIWLLLLAELKQACGTAEVARRLQTAVAHMLHNYKSPITGETQREAGGGSIVLDGARMVDLDSLMVDYTSVL